MRTVSPYERYAESLRSAGLDQTALGGDWARAGEQSLRQAVAVSSPFAETGYFPPDRASAVAYRLELRRGRRLVVEVSFDSAQPGRLFADLFRSSASDPPRLVASLAADATSLTHEVDQDATYLLRVQPELLRSGRFTLTERTLSSLVFPVSGLTAKAVQSLFGAARDAGTREHEGLDIFATRGTPAVAVRDGVAQPDTNNLGGNVVWLQDHSTGRNFYYAHLDRWAIQGRTTVRAGDVLGYVGNTGNARTTSPHLHFGIYERGAIDPLPFLEPDEPPAAAPRGALEQLGELVRVVPARTPLRQGPDRTARAVSQLDRASVAQVLGLSQSALRVALPDGVVGYVDSAVVTLAARAATRQRLPVGSVIRELPASRAPVVATLAREEQVEVLGRFGGFDLARLDGGRTGWIESRVQPRR